MKHIAFTIIFIVFSMSAYATSNHDNKNQTYLLNRIKSSTKQERIIFFQNVTSFCDSQGTNKQACLHKLTIKTIHLLFQPKTDTKYVSCLPAKHACWPLADDCCGSCKAWFLFGGLCDGAKST